MKLLFFLVLVAVAATAPNFEFCTPDPVQNYHLVEVTATEIFFAFDEPDNIEECPLKGYLSALKPVGGIDGDNSDYDKRVFMSKHINDTFFNVEPDTNYTLSTVALSTNWVESAPVNLSVTTPPPSCTPDPVQNQRILGVTSTEIFFAYDEPANIDECPINSYINVLKPTDEMDEELPDYGMATATNTQHNNTFFNLEPDTNYTLISIAYSNDFVPSEPATLTVKTAPDNEED